MSNMKGQALVLIGYRESNTFFDKDPSLKSQGCAVLRGVAVII